MTERQQSGATIARPLPGFTEFVVLMAITIGLVALSIDNLLPAFGPIAADYGIQDGNRMQLLIYVFMIAFALMQIVYGPLADSFGRKPILMLGLSIYAIGTIMAVFADSYEHLLIARFVQGLGAAAPRVLTIAITRDCFEGREMARVMSFVMMVFIILPVFAPASGSLILALANWHMIFVSTLVLAIAIAVWFYLRMPETLHPEYRHKLSLKRIARDIKTTITTRQTLGYSTAMGLMFACLMAYIGSAQQIFETEVYGLGVWFPLVFGMIAACMSVSSFVNAHLVRKIGMHKLSQGGLVVMAISSLINLCIAWAFDGAPPLPVFGVGLTITLFCFSMTMPNFNSLAMEPVGRIAGTASSVIGVYSTLIGVVAGGIIGQQFNGTVIPLVGGYLVLAILAIAIIGITERGKFFHTTHQA
ncbi:multidrug effflux MFS transporter [Thalassospira alkalitolerans]|uniref:Bcr/CflA family efflux transporter n=1 Tax=Thalassospira alkalitolerans TaxID=1293890 RepID=A0A1Y2LEH5_9PROT|nr:multidrug effflux MFS transporter [Thalassospira alkalitolerans]OSQ49488.1 major facilitator transporter [Thalassospira alkalitolerans]|tara:strand:- start:111567 stop:112817 length:1251 start_codon:yes stop_codon:yes gene_type:complete